MTSNRLPILAENIRTHHRAALDAAGTATRHAMTCGEMLIEAKKELSHGEWLPWLKEHCEISERTAQAYMRIARKVAEMDIAKSAAVADLPLRTALKAIADEQPKDALWPAANASPEKIWAWAGRQVDGPFNSIDMENYKLFEGKMLRQLDLSYTAGFCLGLMCESDIELPAGKIPALDADEIPVLQLVESCDLRDALEKLHAVASGSVDALDIDFDELQHSGEPRFAANVVGVAEIVAARFAGFVLTEIDHRAAQFKTYETWHADAVRVHAALMAFLEARYTAFEQQCAQNKGDRDPGDPSYALDKAGSAQ